MAINSYLNETDVRRIKQDELVWREKLNDSFFSKFVDFPNPADALASQVIEKASKTTQIKSKDGLPIKMVRDLEKGLGDRVEFPFVQALSGKGIKGSQGISLSGTEESITSYKSSLELEEYCHAVIDGSVLGRKKALFDIPYEMRVQMAAWGVRAFDELCFQAVEASTNIYYPGTHTQDSDITSADTITVADLKKVRVQATTRNAGARYLMEPVMYKGKQFFVVIMSPDSFYDLKEDSDFKDSLMNAYQRGTFETHPLFSGATEVTSDGFIIYANERAGAVSNYGSGGNVAGSKITVMGANALHIAMGGVPGVIPEEKDYRRQKGLSFQMMAGFKIPQFNSIDYGSIQIRCARTNVSGITENISDRVEL